MLNENTRMSLSIATFLTLIAFIVTVVFAWGTASAETEAKIKENKIAIETETKIRKEQDCEINKRLDEVTPMLLENQTALAQVQTDLEWIKSMQSQILERLNGK